MELEALDVEGGLLLLPGLEYAAGLKGLQFANVGLLARGQRLALDDRPTPDGIRTRSEPWVRLAVRAQPLLELDELLAHLGRHRPGDRLDVRPRDDLARVVPGVVDTEPEPVSRPNAPLPRRRVGVMCAGPAGLPHTADLGRLEEDRGHRPGRPRPQKLVLTTPARHEVRLPGHSGTPGPAADRLAASFARSSA